MTQLKTAVANLRQGGSVLAEAVMRGNLKTLATMLGPAYRGFILQRAKREESTPIEVGYTSRFDWHYRRNFPEMAKLYEAAKSGQWNASKDVDWSIDVDPMDTDKALMPFDYFPLFDMPGFTALSERERATQLHGLMAWMLSQFLHGEQGALFAAAQVTECIDGLDGKLFGSTQVVDEGRHVEVFHRYLTEKLQKWYPVNDNLYVILDALMSDSRWDIKFLGMQILVEGLALGAFGTIRTGTKEPLIKEILKYVITDEARHVHYGVLALRDFYLNQLSEHERREREDWTCEIVALMRNRFLAHEFYEEYWAHAMSRAEWDRIANESKIMDVFRVTMFKRIIPNLKRIGLLSDRVRPHYEKMGLLRFEVGKSAPELTASDLLSDA
ncbi:MAG: ferritin-like domain-containing protein [Deltaproteobacteria bacterium]|nr:ferritin-like domain-containing protein [Deltaproteobacteria bacterium]